MEGIQNLKTKCKTQEALVMLTCISHARINDIKMQESKKKETNTSLLGELDRSGAKIGPITLVY